MRLRVASILWRRWNRATFDTLHGVSKGQYDIRLNKSEDLEAFFAGLERTNPTELEGFDIQLMVEPFDGPNPVPGEALIVRFMGPRSERRDWYIRAQRPESAYPLWRPGRGIPDHFDADLEEYLVLISDTRGGFHARWLHADALRDLPPDLVDAMRSSDVGWRSLS